MRINTRVVSDILSGRVLEREGYEHAGAIARAMGVRFPSVISNTFVGPLPAGAGETVVLTTPPISEPIDGAQVILLWQASITAGASVTSHVFHLRRGTTATDTGVGAGPWTDQIAAAAGRTSSGFYFDFPGVVAGQQYSLTVIQTAATGAGTWLDGALLAMVL